MVDREPNSDDELENYEKTADEVRQEMAKKIIKEAQMLKKRRKQDAYGNDPSEDGSEDGITEVLHSQLVLLFTEKDEKKEIGICESH